LLAEREREREREMSHGNEEGGVKGPKKIIVYLFKKFPHLMN